ncbi:MAG: anti-sigma factor family protein [Acidobacteriota bacterium]
MNCSEVERLLTEDLRAAAAQEVRQHIAGCQICRHLQRDLEAIEQLNHWLARQSGAPSGFCAQVVSRASKIRSWRPFYGLAVGVAAALVLMAGVGWKEEADLTPGTAAPILSVDEMGQSQEVDRVLDSGRFEPILVVEGGRDADRQSSDPYLEVLVSDPAGETFILRVPPTIEIRQTDLRREPYLTYVSH